MGKTLHPTPHTLPPGKAFCRKPYLTSFQLRGFGHDFRERIGLTNQDNIKVSAYCPAILILRFHDIKTLAPRGVKIL
jgi:hypothetical protein